MEIWKSVKSSGRKSTLARRRLAMLSAAAAVGLPLVGTVGVAFGDIGILYESGSSNLYLPQTGTYTIFAEGAMGGGSDSSYGGLGAEVQGTINFAARDQLTFDIGAMGAGEVASGFGFGGGGGGGTFLYDDNTSTILAVAGGGGGAGVGVTGGAGQAGTAGQAGAGSDGAAGGTGGDGGQAGPPGSAAGGAGGGGFLTAGASTTFNSSSAGGGASFPGGLAGGKTFFGTTSYPSGGYGGGGAGLAGGGGGGGYSGGGAGGLENAGGGGGSYLASSFTSTSLSSGSNVGNGLIEIEPSTPNLTINYLATGTIAGIIAGTGSVTMAGTGNAILTGANVYSGGTTLSAGTVTIGDGGADGLLPGDVTDNATLAFNRSDSFTYSGNISGTGAIQQLGAGTLVLTGSETYTGATTISAGTLQFGNGGSAALVSRNITDNAQLVLDAGTSTFSGVISGTGGLTKLGGVLILTSQSTYAGDTNIDSADIIDGINNALPTTTNLITNDASLAFNTGITAQTVASLSGSSGSVNLSTNATLTVNQSTNTVYGGQIFDGNIGGPSTDTGKLVKQGTGTLALTATNDYGGGTTISRGSLQIGDGGTTGSVAGNITDNANLAFDRTDSITFSNTVTGSGSLTQLGTGTVAITGADAYSGGTIISAGSLQIGAGGTTGSITNNVTDNANLTFDRSDSITFASQITGSGSVTQSGSGTVTLSQTNNYTGETTVTAGELVIATGGALPDHAASISGGVLQLAKSTGLAQLTSLSVTGAGTLDLENNHLVIDYQGPNPVSSIRGYLATGYAGGAWTGAGIDSSTAASNPQYALGYADGADGLVAGIVSGQIEIKYTLYGDTNLDGAVNSIDFGNMAANFGKSGKVWDQGDFDYNGTVNSIDFGLLASNFGKSASGADVALPESDWAALDAFAAANGLMADVPEPASAAMMVMTGLGILTRRRRRSSRH
ncbi:MAG TPA: autotransporter-associated beta strand repeat-containing protein [Tepidisphaeraceae bacterium]|jgi:autotransporter-associated beta strand protein|nr:autotransporter-associated beta strand repeat-containing protein [Tepidisphaeraceae bacterium]